MTVGVATALLLLNFTVLDTQALFAFEDRHTKKLRPTKRGTWTGLSTDVDSTSSLITSLSFEIIPIRSHLDDASTLHCGLLWDSELC